MPGGCLEEAAQDWCREAKGDVSYDHGKLKRETQRVGSLDSNGREILPQALDVPFVNIDCGEVSF